MGLTHSAVAVSPEGSASVALGRRFVMICSIIAYTEYRQMHLAGAHIAARERREEDGRCSTIGLTIEPVSKFPCGFKTHKQAPRRRDHAGHGDGFYHAKSICIHESYTPAFLPPIFPPTFPPTYWMCVHKSCTYMCSLIHLRKLTSGRI